MLIGMERWDQMGSNEAVRRALLTEAAQPAVFMSARPYDSYGEQVKVELERSVIGFVKALDACYLIHEAHHGLVRVADERLLRDRLVWRRARLWTYDLVVSAVLWLCRLAPLRRVTGWRRI
jgi:hypothetical protein